MRDSGQLKVLSWESCLGSRSPGPVCQVPIFVIHQLSIPENKSRCCQLIGSTRRLSVEGVLYGVPVCVAGFRLCHDHVAPILQLSLAGAAPLGPCCWEQPLLLPGDLPSHRFLQSQGRTSQPLLSEETFRLCNVWLQLCVRRVVHSSCGLSLQQAGGLHWALEKSPWALSSSWPSPASGASSVGPWLRLWADDGL